MKADIHTAIATRPFTNTYARSSYLHFVVSIYHMASAPSSHSIVHCHSHGWLKHFAKNQANTVRVQSIFFSFFFSFLYKIWRQEETGITHNQLDSLELYSKCGSVEDEYWLGRAFWVALAGTCTMETHLFASSALPTKDRTYVSVYYVNTSEDLFRLIV